MIYTGGRDVIPGDDIIKGRKVVTPPFTRSADWPDKKPDSVQVPYTGKANVTQSIGTVGNSNQKWSLRNWLRPDAYPSEHQIELHTPDGKSAQNDVLMHELAHYNERMPTETMEAEVPAVVAETAYSLSNGDRPPNGSAGAPWIYDHISKYGPQFKPDMTPAQREDAVKTFMGDLRGDTSLAKSYRDWLKSEKVNGVGAQYDNYQNEQIRERMEANNKRVQQILGHIEDGDKNKDQNLIKTDTNPSSVTEGDSGLGSGSLPAPKSLGAQRTLNDILGTVGVGVAGVGAASLLAYLVYKSLTVADDAEEGDSEDGENNRVKMPHGRVVA
jgi:hypothetical protein